MSEKISTNPTFEKVADYLARLFYPCQSVKELDGHDQDNILRHTLQIWRMIAKGIKEDDQ